MTPLDRVRNIQGHIDLARMHIDALAAELGQEAEDGTASAGVKEGGDR